MRKLKLQIQLSIDGYIAQADGQSGWMVWNWGPDWTWDKKLQDYFVELKASVDCVLLSRKMAEEGFIGHWARVAESDGPQAKFARYIRDADKVVFTKTLHASTWPDTTLAKGDLVMEVEKLKALPGKDMIVYGGASFVSSLIKAGLIDEFQLFVNPAVLGDGLPIFHDLTARLDMIPVKATAYDCGVVVLVYIPKKGDTGS